MEPITAEELAENHVKWIQKISNLEKKIQELDPEALWANREYMKLRLVKLRAFDFTWNFIFQILERLELAYKLIYSLHLFFKFYYN